MRSTTKLYSTYSLRAGAYRLVAVNYSARIKTYQKTPLLNQSNQIHLMIEKIILLTFQTKNHNQVSLKIPIATKNANNNTKGTNCIFITTPL